MLKVMERHLKTNIAQATELFSLEVNPVNVTSQANMLSAQLADGEWTLSGGVDGTASKGCLNGTYDFVNGECITDCFFGSLPIVHNMKAHKVNVGNAFRREAALEIVTDEKAQNAIIVYLGSGANYKGMHAHSVSQDLDVKVMYGMGVFFRIGTGDVKVLGCTDADKLFISSALGVKKSGSSMIKFESVLDRFYAGASYVAEFGFSYIDSIDMDVELLERVRSFDATFEFK